MKAPVGLLSRRPVCEANAACLARQGHGDFDALQPGVDCLEQANDFPKDGPILIITDGEIENDLKVRREHAFLLPRGNRLPFRARGEVFYFRE